MDRDQVIAETSEDDNNVNPVVVEDVHENDAGSDEEEDECRVCRGPAEQGRPLFAPCKCSGSIGFVHQDCLMSWLEVTRGDGKCELCKTKFRFDPQYAENTPNRLPAHEVFLGLASRALAKWLPWTLRIFIAISIWFIVAPFLTTCLYHGWIHRPSSIPTRLKRELIASDIVSGVIIAAVIIISFLSLMSFADFLRVHWQRGPNNGQEGRNDNAFGGNNNDNDVEEKEGKSDDTILKLVESRVSAREVKKAFDAENNVPAGLISETVDQIYNEDTLATQLHDQTMEKEKLPQENDGNVLVEEDDDVESDVEEEEDAQQHADALNALNDLMNNEMDPPENNVGPQPQEPQFDAMDPALQDDQADMEINIALDELLGLRGPIGTLIRNLLWLLAFNATYLGIFAFVPRTVGSAVYSSLLNTTLSDKFLKSIPFVHSEDEERITVVNIISSVIEESLERDTTFRLTDVTTVTLGYLSIATTLVLAKFVWTLSQYLKKRFGAEDGAEHPDIRNENEQGKLLEIALDATVTVVKVGVLLFLKMFILPLMLGLWLDGSTMSLFGHEVSSRIKFAGGDLFSFILLHWVAGITFMLLVTVFLLQLREVGHPDLLARVIRPQEPQPDLLGNLMNETVWTHIKRMLLSLGIYAPLLIMHISIPVLVFLATGLGARNTFFHLKFYHIVSPQIQIPIELIIFHLCMLALLERYKNSIGGLQHGWMVFMCRQLGLVDYMLPRSVAEFELVGTKQIFVKVGVGADEVDPFWYELATTEEYFDDIVESNIIKVDSSVRITRFGVEKANGERVLSSGMDNIILPEGNLLPAKRGCFRLKLDVDPDENDFPQIQFWKEVPGDIISRPPEGWDDLGAGGAFVQGRWAWGKEKKSVIERGVAQKTPFKRSKNHRWPLSLMIKVAILSLSSWMAIILTIVGLVSIPLLVGRSIYYLLRVPDEYIHDPLAFCIGASIFFPLASLFIKNNRFAGDDSVKSLKEWISRFSLPPRQKLMVFMESFVLWTLVAPLTLGSLYEIVLVKSSKWFGKEEALVDLSSLLLSWLVGVFILNIWALFAYNSVFTKAFWSNIGNGLVEPPNENAAVNVAGDHNDADEASGDNDRFGLAWQGKNGRVAVFFGIWKSIITKWEWETVDRVGLLEDFARPVSKHVASTLVGSFLIWQLSLSLAPLMLTVGKGGFDLPMFGFVEHSVVRMALFRICTILHVAVQLSSAFRGGLESWFQVAHEAARDEKYLIGETLMDYDPETEWT